MSFGIHAAAVRVHRVKRSVRALETRHDGASSIVVKAAPSLHFIDRRWRADDRSGLLRLVSLPEEVHERLWVVSFGRRLGKGAGVVVGQRLATLGERSVGPDVAAGDSIAGIAPDEGTNHVETSEDDDENRRRKDELGVVRSQLFGFVGRPVKIAEHVAADEQHDDAQPDEAMLIRDDGPVAAKVTLDEIDDGKLGDDEDEAEDESEEIRGAFEDEVAAFPVHLEDENPARGGDGSQRDDGAGARHLKNHHAGAPESSGVDFEHGDGIEVDWRSHGRVVEDEVDKLSTARV